MTINSQTYETLQEECTLLRRRVAELEQQVTNQDAETRLFKALVELSPIGIGVASLDSTIIYANPACKDMSGYGDALVGMPVRAVMNAQEQERRIASIQQSAETGVWQGMTSYLRADGTTFPAQVSRMLIRDDAGELQAVATMLRDMTQTMQYEQALRESETRFRDLSEASFEGVVITENRIIVDVNTQLTRLLGYAPEEIIGRAAWEFVVPADRNQVGWNMHQDGELPYEHGMLRKDGTILFVEVLTRPTTYQGRPAHVTAIRDITRRKQVEVKLRQNQALLQAIMDNSAAAIYVKDMQGRYVLMNRQIIELFGLDPQQVEGKTDYDLLPPDIADDLHKADREVLATGCPVEREETIQSPEGPRYYIALKFPLYAEDGTPYGVCGISTDITARKQAEDELRTFKLLVDNAPDGIHVADPRARLHYANASLRAMSGYGAEVIGKVISDLYTDSPEQVAMVAQQVAEQGSWKGLSTMLVRDGTQIPVSATVFGVPDADGQIQALAAIVRDISEQQRAEQERIELQAQIIEAQQAALRELSTPLIPVSDDVVIMPLIGTVDSQRAQQVMEVLLEGVALHHATTVILDITGVQVVDTQVADAFIRTAQAVKLLGARVLITGIQPEMAQTLVQLGIDLSSIQTHGTLRSGIAAVLKLSV
jgi:PAS domain S-box-containing protein